MWFVPTSSNRGAGAGAGDGSDAGDDCGVHVLGYCRSSNEYGADPVNFEKDFSKVTEYTKCTSRALPMNRLALSC